jgi:beta-lactamase regulating signal transducer with metallopeptidase domain
LYRLLIVLQCACWFNPLFFIALRHFQHERELLCDERVTRSYPKHEYGILLLRVTKEKKENLRAATAGIVMDFGSISERVNALIKPTQTVG